eukprot:TRINITY_DN5808_c0_g1_i6.p1 TRINITY_DN5808_c0_g1~~TRINITY_DN5808_c0_g1_i6.p1  ORF type:complete len:120 (+),score=15.16 TRINITY_DN5808_c0_g1_i6:32-391(+)
MSTGSPNISLPPAPEDDYLFYAEKILMSFNCRDDGDNSCTYSFGQLKSVLRPNHLKKFEEIITDENPYFKKHPTERTKFIFNHLIAIEAVQTKKKNILEQVKDVPSGQATCEYPFYLLH